MLLATPRSHVNALAVFLLLLASVSCRPPGNAGDGEVATTTSAGPRRDPRTTPPADGYLRYRLREDPPDLDPVQASDVVSSAVLLQVHDGLVAFEPMTLAVVPAVASSWTVSDDGLVYDFTLRSDVVFHNGRAMTADDVAWSFTRLLSPSVNAERRWVAEPIKGARAFQTGKAERVEGIEVVSPTHLRFTLEAPFAPFLVQLAMEAASVLPREVYEDVAAAPGQQVEKPYLRHPVGCGPFSFEEWQQGNFIKVKAFDRYYGGKPQLPGITYRFMQDKVTAVEAYKNGELDIVDEIPAGQRRLLVSQLGDEFKKWPQLGTYYFGFNQELPPFKGNAKLRQAINHAVDRKYICENLQEGKDTPAYGIMPPGLPGHDPATARDPYDIEKAKTLLAEAGYPEGKGLDEIILWYNTDDSHARVAQQVQQDVAKIGVRIVLRNLDWGAYLDHVEGSDTENSEAAFYRMGWIADYPDPDNFMTVRLSCDYKGPRGNYDRYCNPAFEAIIDKARSVTDMNERIVLYRQAEQIAVDDAVWLFIYYYGEEALVKPYVKGFQLSPQGDFAVPLDVVSMSG